MSAATEGFSAMIRALLINDSPKEEGAAGGTRERGRRKCKAAQLGSALFQNNNE
jgi:hypothetical protein